MVIAGYFSCLLQLQLASHDLATIVEIQNPNDPLPNMHVSELNITKMVEKGPAQRFDVPNSVRFKLCKLLLQYIETIHYQSLCVVHLKIWGRHGWGKRG